MNTTTKPAEGLREHRPTHQDHATPRTREEASASAGLVGLPKFALLCPTWCRPHTLTNLIECFNRLDYPLSLRELIILDDADQYPQGMEGEGWQVISVPRRFRTLSQKRNTLAALADKDTDAFCAWDDDDSFTPWTLLAHAAALEYGQVSHPSLVFSEPPKATDKEDLNGMTVAPVTRTGLMYQATQAIDANVFWSVGGYPLGNSGVDQKLVGNLQRMVGEFADPCDHYPPFFFYGWDDTNSPHLSSLGREGYDGPTLEGQKKDAQQVGYGRLVPKLRRRWNVIARRSVQFDMYEDHYAMRDWWENGGKDRFEASLT